MDLNDRTILQIIREQALNKSEVKGLSRTWKRAYESLADSADRLDAMIDRTIVRRK